MIEQVIAKASEMRASDIHIVCGIPVRFRVDGELTDMDSHVVTAEEAASYAAEFGAEAVNTTKTVGEADLAATVCDRRLRVNIFMQQEKFSLAIRMLNDKIPNLEDLNLPAVVSTFPEYKNGLILVTGETGSGKSTTLAALLNRINKTANKHIITLEDPIEYVYTPEKCVINQREVGRDTRSFATGLRAALREDPNVVLVGEMRDFETIETALTAAETGHLVFGTIHTNSASDAVDRIVDVFPEERQRQIRLQLSMSLKAVLSQQLLKKKGGGRVAACEIMIVDHAISNLIREAKTPQIRNTLATSAALGSITMENAVAKLLREGMITPEVADKAVGNPDIKDIPVAPAGNSAGMGASMSMGNMSFEDRPVRPRI